MSRKVVILYGNIDIEEQVVQSLGDKFNSVSASVASEPICDQNITTNVCEHIQKIILSFISMIESCGNAKPFIIYDWKYGTCDILKRESTMFIVINCNNSNVDNIIKALMKLFYGK